MQINVPVTVYVVLLAHRQPEGSTPDVLHEFLGVVTSSADAVPLINQVVDNCEVGPLTQRSETYATAAIDDNRAGFVYKVVL